MRHFRTTAGRLILWTVVCLCPLPFVACSGWVAPAELRPALHPLLESGTHRAGVTGTSTRIFSRATTSRAFELDADPELARQRRQIVSRRVGGLLRGRVPLRRSRDDLDLIRRAFGELQLDAAPERSRTLRDLHQRSHSRGRRARVADLVFFEAKGFPRRVGIVTAVREGGAIEAALITRGALRKIRVDRRHPNHRRRRGRIVNTFVRVIRQSDPPGTAYLAGQLVESVRTLLD